MCRFIETIQVNQGAFVNMGFHQERFERSRREVLGLRTHPLLEDLIGLPHGLEQGVYKCRVTYSREIELIEFEPHRNYQVSSLKLVYSDSIEYGHKYADRSELKKLYGQKGSCDDILVVKKNCIADTYIANVLLWDGKEWFTPDTPLLPGTMRASLLLRGIIRECRITGEDLPRFQKLKLINALNDLENGPEIPIEYIH